MRTMQLCGPFNKGQEYSFTVNGAICQIGLEVGERVPFMYEGNSLDPIFEVNGVKYTINDTCILNWGNMAARYVAVKPLINLDKYAIIDVAYE